MALAKAANRLKRCCPGEERLCQVQPRRVTVDLTKDVEGDDKICGSVMDVFLERLGEGET